ncbi:MAG: hypothetical protein Q8M08_00010 [Bacteroidales bacterium]|nr:hypothetical protein [Bacteroidales bacterium]
MKKNELAKKTSANTSEEDTFLRRREVQGTLIKKILAEIDLQPKPEEKLKPGDEMNFLDFANEENEQL